MNQPTMKKIIHLSDLHIGADNCYANAKLIVANIINRMQPVTDYIVVITGDIANNVYRQDQHNLALGLVNQLKESQFEVLLIPGNHDYGNGFWASQKYVRKFKQRFYNNPDIIYPKVDVVDNVLFIGLDSNADELHWYDRMLAEGELGKEQLARLQEVVDDVQYQSMQKVVYLHHHPFDVLVGHQLKDSDELRKVIENKVDVLLFGHLHNNNDSAGQSFHGTWGIKRAYNAGSATHKNRNSGYHRVIDLSKIPEFDYDGDFLSLEK